MLFLVSIMAPRGFAWVFPVPWFGGSGSGLGDSGLGSWGVVSESALRWGVDRSAGLSILFLSSGASLGPLGASPAWGWGVELCLFSRLFQALKRRRPSHRCGIFSLSACCMV